MEAELVGIYRELALEITANLVEACPVDTGNARAHFVPVIGSSDPGGTSQAEGIAALATYRLGDGDVYIANNVPYIDYLIAGSSSQAAPGWDLDAVDRAVATVQARHDGFTIEVTK